MILALATFWARSLWLVEARTQKGPRKKRREKESSRENSVQKLESNSKRRERWSTKIVILFYTTFSDISLQKMAQVCSVHGWNAIYFA